MNTNNTNPQYHPLNLELKENELDEIRTFLSFCANHKADSPGLSILFNLPEVANVNQPTSRGENSYSQPSFINVPEKFPIDNQWLDQMTCEFQDDFLARNPNTDFILLYNYFQKIRDSYTDSLGRFFKNEPGKMISALNGMNRLIDLTVCTIGQTIVNRKSQLIDAQRKETDKLNREFEQFVYIASHDLQQPLTSLISINSILEEEFPELMADKPGTYLQYIRTASERLSSMITDLLNHSRIGRWSPRQKTGLNKVVNYVLNDLETAIKTSGAKISVCKLPSVVVYPVEIKLLFLNLIDNAIKFRKENINPNINILYKKEEGGLHFMIQDNGIGIDEKYADRIFVIFQKLHGHTDYNGNGVGLAHCKKIVKLHGGNIWVNSEPGIGSTFHFTLGQDDQ